MIARHAGTAASDTVEKQQLEDSHRHWTAQHHDWQLPPAVCEALHHGAGACQLS